MISFAVRLVAQIVVVFIRVIVRCVTLVLSQRFPSASLPDVELFASLWLLTQAQYAFRAAPTTASDLAAAAVSTVSSSRFPFAEEDEAPQRAGTSSSTMGSQSSSGSTTDPYFDPVRRPDPISVSVNTVLYPRIVSSRNMSKLGSPEVCGGTLPTHHRQQEVDRQPAVLVFLSLGEKSAQRRVISRDALHVIADASEMDLAVVTLDMLQSANGGGGGGGNSNNGSLDLERTLDFVIAEVNGLTTHLRRAASCNSVNSLSSTPTSRMIHLLPTTGAAAPPIIVLCGAALGGTVAMLLLARRSPAMGACKGLMLFDPFVGWQVTAHARRVSFMDESYSSTNSGDDCGRSVVTAAAGPPAIPTASSSLAPTPGRAALPGIISGRSGGKGGHGRPERTWLRRGLSFRERGQALVADVCHELGTEVKARCRRSLVNRSLRQWFPAAQWSNNGSEVPLCMVLDETSLWFNDQADFVLKWQQTGDDIEAFPWTGDRYDQQAGASVPRSGAALRDRMARPRHIASPMWARRHDHAQGMCEIMQHLVQWALHIRGREPTPTLSVGIGTPASGMRYQYRPMQQHQQNGVVPYLTTSSSSKFLASTSDLNPLPAPMLRVVRPVQVVSSNASGGGGGVHAGVGHGLHQAARDPQVILNSIAASATNSHGAPTPPNEPNNGNSLVSNTGGGIGRFDPLPSGDSISDLLLHHHRDQ